VKNRVLAWHGSKHTAHRHAVPCLGDSVDSLIFSSRNMHPQ
jgi:hypothetical protein